MPDTLAAAANPNEPDRSAERGLDPAGPSRRLAAVRAGAREVAARALASAGFAAHTAPDEHWTGLLHLPRSSVAVTVTVRLPPSFPDALPKVSTSERLLPKRIAHLNGGTLCLVPDSNVLVDADRPADLVAEALRRAIDLLDKGLLGETDGDLDAEFQAYWAPTDLTTVLSLCDAAGPARRIFIFSLEGGSKLIKDSWMVADDVAEAERWADNVGTKIEQKGEGLFVPVTASLRLALSGQAMSVTEVAELVARRGSEAGRDLLYGAISRAAYPLPLVISMPEAPLGAGRRLAAVMVMPPDPKSLEGAANGFRPEHVPVERVLKRIGHEPVVRLHLSRVDRAYLVARGGAAVRLGSARVVLVGAGAVGSEVARDLAALGVGRIRIVDHDVLSPDNVHRHTLGMSNTGYNKAIALTVGLRSAFPHLGIDCRDSRIEDLLDSDPSFVLENDVIVLATGEESLERRLNRSLDLGPPRVHTWLEPLGIGGHSFACGVSPPGAAAAQVQGCFECLYRPDGVFGLVNRTAFTAPGQEIRRSLAGCAGTFSPFSPLDARRTAADAAELVARVVTGLGLPPVLVSWRGLHSEFEAAGYQLSERAAQVSPGSRVEVSGQDLIRGDCSVCGSRVGRPSEIGLTISTEGLP